MSIPLNLSLFSGVLTAKTVSGDLNNIVKPGFYYVNSPVNNPIDNWPYLIVNSAGTGRVVQVLTGDTDDGNGPWFRKNYEGTWSEWRQVPTMKQVTDEVTRLLTTVEF